MRRIESLSEELINVGDWAKVKIKVYSTMITGLIGRTSTDYLCFASNYSSLNGSSRFGSTWSSVIGDFRYGWTIRVRDCASLKLSDICKDSSFDVVSYNIRLVEVIPGNESLIVVDSSIEDAIAENETSFTNNKYETSETYCGVHGYHHHHGVYQNKPKAASRGYKIGVELEIEFNNRSLKDNWSNDCTSNWFYCERDGSLNDNGTEIITIPMNPKDIKDRNTWERLISYLSNKAKSWDSPRCGLHVHIGREILGNNPEQQSETIGKLLYLYHHFVNGTTMNTKIFGRDRAYNEKDGKTPEGNAVATLGSGVLKLREVKETLKEGMIRKTRSDRYFDINLQNSNTIEFRKGRGSIKTSRIIMVIEYCEVMCKYAKSAKWEEISKEKFIEYVKTHIKKDAPLYRFFEAGERCDF